MEKINVVLVDDEVFICKVFSMALKHKYNVKAFSSSADALTYILTNPKEVDVLVCDYHMPDLTGFEILQKVKEVKPEIKSVLMSGAFPPKNEQENFSRFIKKPLSPEKLSENIKNIFKGNNV